jgi:hypothetical protein
MPSGTEKHATRSAERGGLNRILLCMFLLTIADTHFAGAQVSDISDSLWAIVLPTATAVDIDMGRVRVNDSKDSVVSGFITNTGPVAIRIEAITFDGIDAGMFDLQSGPPPFEIAIGEAKDVEFRFTPSSAGVKTATITLRTQAGSSSHSIRGEAVLPGIEVLAVLVDFGSVAVGEMKDTVVAAIRNIGSGALDISGIRQLGPDLTQFSVLSGDGAFTLGPGEERSIELRFAPTKGGRTSGSVGWYHDGVGSPAMVHLFGNGKAPEGRATIAVDTIRARVGEIVDIPVYLREQTDLVSSGATGFYSEFRYNASLLAPIGDTPKGILSDGECTILLETLPAQPDSRGRLTTLQFIAMLGNAEGTPLRLEHSFAVGGNIVVTEIPGYFLLTDLCREGGVRLFHEYGSAGLRQNRPNPFNAATIIEYDVIERASTRLYVMDMLGRIQAVLLDAIVEAGSYTISFDASSLASGTYVCVLQTPSQRFLRLMEVVK